MINKNDLSDVDEKRKDLSYIASIAKEMTGRDEESDRDIIEAGDKIIASVMDIDEDSSTLNIDDDEEFPVDSCSSEIMTRGYLADDSLTRIDDNILYPDIEDVLTLADLVTRLNKAYQDYPMSDRMTITIDVRGRGSRVKSITPMTDRVVLQLGE